jgi:hypothetical protein
VSRFDTRRLAAVDMWGSTGSARRRRLIRAEFIVGVVGCGGLGLLCLARGSGWVGALGFWLLGAGVNYLPLALHAQQLSRPGALEAELEGVDTSTELRRMGVQQGWIAVPFAVALAAIAEAYRQTSSPGR